MKTRNLINGAAMFFIFLLVSVGGTAEFRRGENVNVEGDFSDNLFAAGGQVDARLHSTDDVFLAGGKVGFTGDTSESLWAAGGDLNLQNAESRNSVLVGGNISLDRARLRELIVAGGNVRIQNSEIRDDLVAAGGEVLVDQDTKVAGSAMLGGGLVTLAGQVSGDVEVYANQLRLGPTAVISGNLTHTAQSIEIADGARVEGRTIANPSAQKNSSGVMGMLAGIVFMIGTLLVVPVLSSIFPKAYERAQNQIQNRFWETLGKGTATALVLPVVWLLVLVSVIGTPLAIVSIPFAIVAGVLAWTFAIYAFSIRLRTLFKKDATEFASKQKFLWTFVGSLMAMIVLGIPFVGPLFALFAFISGLGALYNEMRSRMPWLVRSSPVSEQGSLEQRAVVGDAVNA